MRYAPRWRAFIPTSRQIRFAVTKWLERAAPGLCPIISSSTREAEFETLAAREPIIIVEAAEAPFPPDWIARFALDFERELQNEGHVPETSELELQLALFEDAWVFGHTGQVVDARTNRSIRTVTRGSAVPGILAARRLDGIAFSLLTGVPGKRRNYFHFLMERLPEHLAALGAAVEAFGPLTLLLPATDHPLDSALVSEARRRHPELPVRRIRTSEKLRCEAVVFHRARRSSRFRSPANRRLLSMTVEAMRHSVQVSSTAEKTRRLFVSRADARKPRLLNEDEVFARIEHFGFDRVMPGRLPLADQVSLFSGAQIVAGAHGAGLTNLIFMPKGGALTEILGRNLAHGAYAWLSHLSGHDYRHVVSDQTAENFDFRLTGAALDAFEREVDAALERFSRGECPNLPEKPGFPPSAEMLSLEKANRPIRIGKSK